MIINSVDRALDVIILLYETKRELGVSEIAQALDTYKSTVHRTLMTLEAKGFVQQNPSTEKYWLGMKLFVIGMEIRNKMSIKKVIKPYCDELSKEFGEVVNASVLDISDADNPQGIIIYKSHDSNQLLTVNPLEGSASPLYGSSVGKCLLAFNDIDVKTLKGLVLKKHTENTVASIEELEERLDRVKQDLYALDDEELEVGLTCIGAPILDSDHKAIAAISLSGPTQRMKTGDFDLKIKRVKEVAEEISKKFQ